ncbi:OmpA family protein [Fusobacterium sp. MFO224]|uniref:OmpA family protein n=1 Tax=Fusobacterium sp. MFO224 TaxID=3378070 RepID=UPI0038550BC5
MKSKRILISFLLGSILITGCANDFVRPEGSTSYTSSGAVGGAVAGALAGQVIGQDTKGTLIGAAAGALLGTAVGSSMQQQENEFRNVLYSSGVGIVNTGNSILLTLPGGLTFPIDGAKIKPEFTRQLNSIAYVLNKYPNSRIKITGHTDNTGSYNHNLSLSEQRAYSVRNYLVRQGVASQRITSLGLASDLPIASNATKAGRQANRRVTIEVISR